MITSNREKLTYDMARKKYSRSSSPCYADGLKTRDGVSDYSL